jgi:hypothetical protein
MREAMSEFPVIGENEQPGRIGIEPTHVEDAFLEICDQIPHARPPAIIGHATHHPRWLVHRHDTRFRCRYHTLAIDSHHGRDWVDSGAQLSDDSAVDLNATRGNQLLTGPA